MRSDQYLWIFTVFWVLGWAVILIPTIYFDASGNDMDFALKFALPLLSLATFFAILAMKTAGEE